jgi:hypothetical protein
MPCTAGFSRIGLRQVEAEGIEIGLLDDASIEP